MSDLFNTGIRPLIDGYLTKKSEEVRDYGSFWSASSAGYCMRLNILKRLKIPSVPEIVETSLSSQLTFEGGHFLHWWLQDITKKLGVSIAQELELQDEDLMVRGHIDDLVLISSANTAIAKPENFGTPEPAIEPLKHLILYDYKSAHGSSFKYKVKSPMGHYHKMQLGTYMYMLNTKTQQLLNHVVQAKSDAIKYGLPIVEIDTSQLKTVTEGRILSIDKTALVDWEPELRTHEHQLMWSPALEKEIVGYWRTLQGYWDKKTLPACTCLNYDGGFMGKRSSKGKVYNPYFYNDVPCSIEWAARFDQAKEFTN